MNFKRQPGKLCCPENKLFWKIICQEYRIITTQEGAIETKEEVLSKAGKQESNTWGFELSDWMTRVSYGKLSRWKWMLPVDQG